MSAVEFKNQGNKALTAGLFQEAHEFYSKAIELDSSNAIFFANRAQVEIKLEEYGSAIQDASRAIDLDPKYLKSYYRRAVAFCGVFDYKSAVKDYQTVLKSQPNEAATRQKLDECKKLLRQAAFAKAIEVEDEPSVLEKLNLESLVDDDGLDIDDPDFVNKMIAHFKSGKKLSRKKVYQLILRASEIFDSEPTITDIPVPDNGTITVCGDTHGQFYDLLNIFDFNGFPSEKHTYLFNGDFVDRGSWSTEIALTLYALKIKYPKNMYINRGNHETDSMNQTYGFAGECKAKYTNPMVFKAFSESFTKLPLGALIAEKYLVLHGGLFSSDDVTIDDLRKINRFAQRQPGQEGLMMEMLWTDPQPENGRSMSKRGVGLQFGPDVTKRFCDKNGLSAVIRSHEVRDEGYSVEHNGQLITVFSAPNYCDSLRNKGAVINIGSDLELNYKQFGAVPHPNVKSMAYASPVVS